MESASPNLPPRLLLPSDRADLRATWHVDRGSLVVSLWHDRVCAASAPLPLEQAARLAGFLVDHLAARAVAAEAGGQPGTAAGADRAAPAEADDAPDHPVTTPGTEAAGADRDPTVPLQLPHERHLRPAPEPGAAQRTGAALDEAIAAGGTTLKAAVDAARRTWRSRRD